jgi:pimeloyl-ACP methyl ester carboxylesterase
MTAYRTSQVNGTEVFYREGGDPAAPTLLLLHGFPSSSAQYQQLIERLEDRYHVIAPDYPGFGQSLPLEGTTTFDRIVSSLKTCLTDQSRHMLDAGPRFRRGLGVHGLGAIWVALLLGPRLMRVPVSSVGAGGAGWP